ncbi:hypothetical protein ACFUMH_12740 [Cellulomonas sp. NPDC057328]|uniref:hypothetical protein n=1 Tax=Cellulomonas sp. NPDC057328 TaxID=3346101 RepID=UPI00362FD1F5
MPEPVLPSTPSRPAAHRSHAVDVLARGLRPLLLVVPLYVLVVGYLGWAFVGASTQARDAAGDGVFPRTLLGMPVLEGFALDGRFGVHVGWGTLVLLVLPALLGAVAGAVVIARAQGGRR